MASPFHDMVAFPFCKINLGLQILNKQPDGYHSISTCFFPVRWTDVLEILPASKTRFTQTGITIPGEAADNLCLKAYHLLQNDFNLSPVEMHLHKIIPTGAGLGGGSSDAAHTLTILNGVFELGLSQEQLMSYASRIGSDCSYFVQDKPMLGSGRGEILEAIEIDLNGYHIALITPDLHVSTAEAYSRVTPFRHAVELKQILKQPVIKWRDQLKNDFEESVFNKLPAIKELKEQMYSLGALYASMSGSGSSVFGIFEREIDLRSQFRNVQGWAGQL
ncbi:4-(cytidine 5'-diphospho)-2-C-methyl-D-erythritol kinase [soil metagenome]